MELCLNIGGNGQYKCLIGCIAAISLSCCLLEDNESSMYTGQKSDFMSARFHGESV